MVTGILYPLFTAVTSLISPGTPPGTPPGVPPGTLPGVPPGTLPGVPPGTLPGVPPGTPPGVPPGTPPGVPPGTPPGVPPGTPPTTIIELSWVLRIYQDDNNHEVIKPDEAQKFFDNIKDKKLTIVILIHDSDSKLDDEIIKEYIKKFTDKQNPVKFCFVILDWTEKSKAIQAIPGVDNKLIARNIIQIIQEFAKLLLKIFDLGLDPTKFHIIGIGMGVHIGWGAASETKKKNKICGRLTALDGQNGYELLGLLFEKDCAIFFDFYHCSSNGILTPSAKCDFFYNCCCPKQPGCTTDTCSRGRCAYYFLETFTDQCCQQAVQAQCCEDWRDGKVIQSDPPACAGFWVNQSLSGSWFCSTSSGPKFGLGKTGTKPQPCS